MREFIAAITGLAVTYLAFAFVKAEIDFTLWPEITRGVCAITAVIFRPSFAPQCWSVISALRG